MNKTLFVPAALIVALIILATPVSAKVLTNTVIPLDVPLTIPSSPPETLHLTGNLHVLFAITYDNSGGEHIIAESQPQGVKGTTDISGWEYVGAGVNLSVINGKVGGESTTVVVFNFIGKGQAPNLKVTEDMHITVLPDGTVTATFDHVRVTFK